MLSPCILSAFSLPLSNVSFSCFLPGLSLSLLSFLVPLFGFLPLTWPLPFQCQPSLRCCSLLSNSQTLLCSHLPEDHPLPFYLSGVLSCPMQFRLWPLDEFCRSSHFAHTRHADIEITTGAGWKDHCSNSAFGSWIRSGASKRDLGTQKGIAYIVEQKF